MSNYILSVTKKDFSGAYIDENQWSVYQQYEAALKPLKNFSEFCQSAQVIVHWELFEAQRALELLAAPFLLCTGIPLARIMALAGWLRT